MLLWLVFGASFSPLRDVPGQAARLVRINPGAVAQAAVIPVPRFLADTAESARGFWSATQEEAQESAPPERLTWGARLERAADRARLLAFHGLRMTGETLQGNFREGGDQLRLLGDDAKAIWIILAAPDPPQQPARGRQTTSAPQPTYDKEA
jgi:hypothetical protein